MTSYYGRKDLSKLKNEISQSETLLSSVIKRERIKSVPCSQVGILPQLMKLKPVLSSRLKSFQKVEYFIPLKEKEKRRQRNDNPYPNYPSAENLLLSEQCCYFRGTNPQIADPHQANGKPNSRFVNMIICKQKTILGIKTS